MRRELRVPHNTSTQLALQLPVNIGSPAGTRHTLYYTVLDASGRAINGETAFIVQCTGHAQSC